MKIQRTITVLLISFHLVSCAPAFVPGTSTEQPCVNISASETSLKVGQATIITGSAPRIGNIGDFSLMIRDVGTKDFAQLVNTVSFAATTEPTNASQILKFVSISGKGNVVLQAQNIGSTEVAFSVYGENYCNNPAGSYTSNGLSKNIIINVTP